ncbi:uncharacterized protein F5891DRAFT_893302, partial [Suillus fuscotomentosus]
PSHIFHPDNLLQVHPGSRHPILNLTKPMEKEWNAKLAHTSKTLPEAVCQYHRRYSRAPPPSFNRWYVTLIPSILALNPSRRAYIQEHNIQLPEGYNLDLTPFWGVNPACLQVIQLA